VLPRGEPLTALDFLRHTAIGQHVPTEALVDTIRRVVRCRLEDQLRERCQHSDAVNLAVDEWCDRFDRAFRFSSLLWFGFEYSLSIYVSRFLFFRSSFTGDHPLESRDWVQQFAPLHKKI
jgi:hypothetical protein